jgi:glutamate-1-semialdehyde aminotransferase
MTSTAKWSGGFPLYLDSANGAHLTDVDSQTYADFALGDPGATAGHAPPPYCMRSAAPFHNIALMCRATTGDDVDMHTELFSSAVESLLGGLPSRT